MNDQNTLYAKTNFGLVILISCVATIGGFLFGYDSGVINGTVTGLDADDMALIDSITPTNGGRKIWPA